MKLSKKHCIIQKCELANSRILKTYPNKSVQSGRFEQYKVFYAS